MTLRSVTVVGTGSKCLTQDMLDRDAPDKSWMSNEMEKHLLEGV